MALGMGARATHTLTHRSAAEASARDDSCVERRILSNFSASRVAPSWREPLIFIEWNHLHALQRCPLFELKFIGFLVQAERKKNRKWSACRVFINKCVQRRAENVRYTFPFFRFISSSLTQNRRLRNTLALTINQMIVFARLFFHLHSSYSLLYQLLMRASVAIE